MGHILTNRYWGLGKLCSHFSHLQFPFISVTFLLQLGVGQPGYQMESALMCIIVAFALKKSVLSFMPSCDLFTSPSDISSARLNPPDVAAPEADTECDVKDFPGSNLSYQARRRKQSSLSGLMCIVLELNMESERPPKSPTFTPLNAITGLSGALYCSACFPHKVRRTEYPDLSTSVNSRFCS